MGTEYNIHKDFKRISKIKVRNLSAGFINMMNAIAKISRSATRLSPQVVIKKHRIKRSDGTSINVTVYEPKYIEDKAPCLIYFHGGAFVLGEASSHVHLMCDYALSVPCKVVFVHYRLALKHPFPKGLEDCYNSLLWVSKNANCLGIDAARIGIGGDSAGGALAAAVGLMTRDRKGPKLCLQMLIYPVLDSEQNTESAKAFTDTPVWNSRLNDQMWKIYLRNGNFGMLQYASPAKADSLKNLPFTYIETAEFDCLRDEGKNYATKLGEDGIIVQLEETKGTIHGFDGILKSEITQATIKKRVAMLKKAFIPTYKPM